MKAVKVVMLGVVLGAWSGPLLAQVGHDPAHSPFRDITTRQSVTFMAGTFLGNRAKAGVGAQQGAAFGVRLRTFISGPIELSFGVTHISSQRITIDATQPESSRVGGPIQQDLIAADLGLGLSLTGLKTWHGLAPYVGVGVGIIAPTRKTVDPGGYRASSGFSFAPTIGVRARISRGIMLQVEARDHTIRYEWPLRYFDPVDSNGDLITPPILDSKFKTQDLTHNLLLSIGLSYNFSF